MSHRFEKKESTSTWVTEFCPCGAERRRSAFAVRYIKDGKTLSTPGKCPLDEKTYDMARLEEAKVILRLILLGNKQGFQMAKNFLG